MLTLSLYLPLLLQATDSEIPIFRLILILAGAIFMTYLCLRIGLRIMGSSFEKATRKPILKRFTENDKRRRR